MGQRLTHGLAHHGVYDPEPTSQPTRAIAALTAAILFAPCFTQAQTSPAPPPAHKAKSTARPAMAVWTPDVQQTLGVAAADFNTTGLNRLTKVQLTALEASIHPDPRKHTLTCPASGTVPSGRLHVLVTVAGDDSTGEIAGAVRSAVASLSDVDIVNDAANADRALHIVIQEQTMGKRTIGFTAAYVTVTPCSDTFQGKTTDAELKGQLGTYTDPKGPDLARDLAGMLDKDLQPLRRQPAATNQPPANK